VLVSDWVDGLGFEHVQALPQPDRDRFGEILMRFYFGAMRHVGAYNADPHPGNYLLMPDGRVAFLDFGMAKPMPTRQLDALANAASAYITHDPAALRAAAVELGAFPATSTFDTDAFVQIMEGTVGWLLHDGERTIGADIARTFMFACHKHTLPGTVPRDEVFFGRMDIALTSVLAKLQATGNWHRIMREILLGEPPRTKLGHAEVAHFTRPDTG
jgi:hypothetical protein